MNFHFFVTFSFFSSFFWLNEKRKMIKRKRKIRKKTKTSEYSLVLSIVIFFYFLSPTYKITKTSFFTTFETPFELVLSNEFKLKYYEKSPHCSLCNFTVRNRELSNSSPRDVSIIPAVSITQNIEVFVRTLRTTGSLCSCVILLDNYTYNQLSQDAFSELTQCGAQIINCGPVNVVEHIDAYNYCYAFTFLFIEANRHMIDRVIRFDMFDTVLQGDPFNSQVDEKLNLIDEGTQMHAMPHFYDINAVWISHFDPDIKKYNGLVYKCAGYIGGSAETMYKCFGIFIEYMRIGTINNDQGAVNYFYFNNIYKKEGIDVVGIRKFELVRHCAFIPLENHNALGDVRTIRDESSYASVVHHYYMNAALQYSILQACPRKHNTTNFYISHCPEFCVSQMEKFILNCIENCTYNDYFNYLVQERDRQYKKQKEEEAGFIIGIPLHK